MAVAANTKLLQPLCGLKTCVLRVRFMRGFCVVLGGVGTLDLAVAANVWLLQCISCWMRVICVCMSLG
jgi:hypothetical protein